MVADFPLFEFLSILIFNVLIDLLLESISAVHVLGVFMNMRRRHHVDSLSKYPAVAIVEEGHFVM